MPPRREPSTGAVKPATVAATTTRTRTRAATNPPNPDDLADNLATNLTVADPKGKARARVPVAPRATTSRATRAPTRTASKSGSSEVTGLTQAFAGKLAITEQAPTKSQEERCQEAMRLVNTASRGLSEIAESGWKFGSSASATSKSKSSDKTPVIAGHYKTAMASLVTLREFRPDDVDIERAASSIVGKLLSMEMYDAALDVLTGMHAHLPHFYTSYTPNQGEAHSTLPIAPLLCLPLPSSSIENDILLTLLSNYLTQVLTCVSYVTFSRLAVATPSEAPIDLANFTASLYESTTLLQWLPSLADLPAKHMDSVLTRAYTALTKSSVLWTPTSTSQAKAVYRIRTYALRVLLHTSSSVLKPTTFWDQSVKFSVALVKDSASSTMSSEEKADVTQTILDSLEEILDCATKTRGAEEAQVTWFSGTGFLSFCEYWMDFAKRVNKPALLQRISSLIRSTTSAAISSATFSQEPSVRTATNDVSTATKTTPASRSMKQEATLLYAALTQATVALEQPADMLDAADEESLANLSAKIDGARSFLELAFADDEVSVARSQEDIRYADKIRRSFERLRRAAVKTMEGLFSKGSQGRSEAIKSRRNSIKAIVERCTYVLGDLVTVTPNAGVDLLTPLLDSLFALARAYLVITNPMTYDDCFDALSRAVSVLANVESKTSNHLALANYLRCVSGAFHNIAGTLYQANYYAHAIRFLDQSCELGEKALRVYRSADKIVPSEGADDSWKDKEEAWSQLEEQMYRRWEILGVCHSKIGDRKFAYESFANAIKAFPFFSAAFLDCTSNSSSSAAFETSPTVKYIGGIIERMTYTGICDLRLDPSAVSLKTYQIPEGVSSPDKSHDRDTMRSAIVGILLEKQVEALEGCRWKDYAREAMHHFLDDALEAYHTGKTPIRRARILLKILELSQSNSEGTLSAVDYDDVGEEVDTLLSSKKLSLDDGLLPFREQFRAILKLRLALLVHQQAQTSQFSRVVAYAEEAGAILKGIFAPAPRQSFVPPPSPKVTRTQATRKVSAKAQPAASRLPAVRARTRSAKTAAAVPVTPRAKRGRPRLSGGVIPAPVFVAQPSASLDALPVLVDLLRTCAHLLGLLGQVVTRLQLLILARRICERVAESRPDDYINVSIELAHEYVTLGKTGKGGSIYQHTMNAAKKLSISEETHALLLLRYAESQATIGNILKSSWAYCEAYALSEVLPADDKTLPTAQRIIMRVAVLERAAMAANTFALVQYSRDDPSVAINGLLQSLRLWNRALDSLSKLAPPSPTKKADDDSDNPFLTKKSTPQGADSSTPDSGRLAPRKEYPPLPAANGIEWRIVHGLLATLFALTQAYVARGSPREAEYFAQQAKDLAESLNTPAMVGRAFARLGEIYLHLHQVKDSHAALVRAGQLMAGTAGPDAAEVRRLHAEYTRMHANGKRAQQLYDEAISMLEELESVFTALDGQNVASRKSLGGVSPQKSPGRGSQQEALAPSVLMAALRQNIWLLHAGGEEYTTLLERFRALSATSETKAEESALLAKLSLESVYTRFQADMFLNSLSESIITLPMGIVKDSNPMSTSGQEVVAILDNAEKLFWSDLGLMARRGNVFNVRDAAISLALIQALQTSLGGTSASGAVLATRLLDMSAALTLRREVLEVVQHKSPNANAPEDLQWPLMTSNGSVLPPPKKRKTRFMSFDSDVEDDDLDTLTDTTSRYWKAVEEKYKNEICDPTNLSTPLTNALPPNWTVVSISLTEDKKTLFTTRQQSGKEPLMFCLPLSKGRRDDKIEEDGEYESFLTFDDAMKELQEIIHLSDEGTRQAINVRDDRKARAAWWAERAALDQRMKELLRNIEASWLGAFKTILSEPTGVPHDLLDALWTSLERVFRQCIASPDKRQKVPLRPNDALLGCFALLSPICRDEELEDLVYFVLDLYQFHGVQVATAEIDMIIVLVDLRGVLEEHAARAQGRLTHTEDAHTFLVLDKNVAGIPWESIPILRGRSVSRIPGVDFLLDRLQYVRQTRGVRGSALVDRFPVDPRNAYFVLNPSGDLKNTEGRFAPWLKEMKSVGWEGIVGRPPSELQLANALTRKDLVIYFGHGGAEQYIRSHKVRHLPRCAATMLWGCSSGALKDMGDFDRIGTPYNYVLSGCPTLVANLWDVTDRDIDKFSQAVFDRMHLTTRDVRAWTPDGNASEETSIVTAVAQSRDVCKLKYLTGAAPVVYGIPFYL